MNGERYLLDSNFIIRLLKGNLELAKFIDDSVKYFAVSVIIYMEVLGYNFSNQNEFNMVQEIFQLFNILYLDEAVTEKIIEIRKLKRIKLPDAIIATTAIELDLILVTANYDDFKNIPNLQLVNK